MTEALTDILGRLTREQLIEVIVEAAEAYDKCGALLRAFAAYAALDDEGRQAVHDYADAPTDEMEPWARAIEHWDD
jgi:hypothetical protein